MPAIISSYIRFDTNKGYFIDIHELTETFPHIIKDKEVELYLIELRDQQDKLIRRFKPFKKFKLKVGEYWEEVRKALASCLLIPEDIVSKFNIGSNYKVIIMLNKYDGKPFLPLEIKCVGYNTQRILEYLSKIEANLLLLSLDQPVLNKACSYLWDAYFRLEENDIEGSRTALRNSLQVLKKEFLSQIALSEKSEESQEFPKKMQQLLTRMTEFLHYGGPHPGPAPRATTEMIISLTTEVIKFFQKGLEKEFIIFKVE
ncbi:MAG TPA: hypothetical protein ENG68_02400 [bacterium]|nr:hypothetical protein [bacterium]